MMLERSRKTVVFYGIHLNLEKNSGVCFFCFVLLSLDRETFVFMYLTFLRSSLVT
uniref:Uncharacterized protein n=1 Tax=Anguilla anguilla TaxID=7936 RepID=A0A0E9XTT9_ANGAN